MTATGGRNTDLSKAVSMAEYAARLTALQGAKILFYPTATGWPPPEKKMHGESQFQSWQTVQPGHVITNGCYVAEVDRTRLEEFDIRDVAQHPKNQIIAKA